jgi:hypothetical protein
VKETGPSGIRAAPNNLVMLPATRFNLLPHCSGYRLAEPRMTLIASRCTRSGRRGSRVERTSKRPRTRESLFQSADTILAIAEPRLGRAGLMNGRWSQGRETFSVGGSG